MTREAGTSPRPHKPQPITATQLELYKQRFVYRGNHSNMTMATIAYGHRPCDNESYYLDYREGTYRPHHGNKACRPQTSLYYLKIHKTASSVVTNILQRLSLSHRLRRPWFLLYNSFPSPDMNWYLIPLAKLEHLVNSDPDLERTLGRAWYSRGEAVVDSQADIIDGHTVWNQTAVREVLGVGAVNMVSLRHPYTHLVSSMTYFGLWKNTSHDHVTEFLKNPQNHRDNIYNMRERKNISVSVARNFMAYSFGYDSFYKNLSLKSFLSHVEKNFPVAIIVEQMTESLVLLKRTLCWELQDILFIKLNAQTKDSRSPSVHPQPSDHHDPPPSDHLISLHRSLSPVDYALYNMFYDRHQRLVSHYGNDLQREVTVFEAMLDKLNNFCSDVYERLRSSDTFLNSSLEFEATEYSSSFRLTAVDCLLMVLRTNYFEGYLGVLQHPGVCRITFPTRGLAFYRLELFCSQKQDRWPKSLSILTDPYYWMLKNPFEK